MKTLIILLAILSGAEGAVSQNLTLEAYLSKIREQNLEIKMEQAKADVFEAKSSGISLPPPMLGITQMKEESGNTANGFELTQTLPFPTKLFADYEVRKYDLKSQTELKYANQKQILLNAKYQYFVLWQKQAKLILLEEKKNILLNHIRLSRSAARSDNFASIHVLKTESDLDYLENEIEVVKQEFREKQIELVTSLNEDPENFNFNIQEPAISVLPQVLNVEEGHWFQAKKFNLESLQAKEFEAKSAWLPDFNIKYKEIGATSTTMKSSEIMLGVTLPFIYFWEPAATAKQAGRERLQGEYELEKERRSVQSQKLTQLNRLKSLNKQIEKLSKDLIPRLEKNLRQMQNIALRDLESLQNHRETMEALPDLKIRLLDLRLEYEQALMELKKYTPDGDI